MIADHLKVDDLVRLARAGGGFSLHASVHEIDDLIRIARAAAKKQSRLVLEGSEALDLETMIRIARAGEGCVFFE